MPFAIPETAEKKTYTKTQFLYLSTGTHIVRFLEPTENADMVLMHNFVLGKYTLKCPGDGCPICENNKKLIVEHPEDFRDQKGYSPRSTNYLINVLDRTEVKVCPNCGEENLATEHANGKPTYRATCSSCNSFITEVKPMASNKVKLLKFGVQLATQLNTIEMATCDTEGNPIGLTNMDVALVTSGEGRKKLTTPVPSSKQDKLPDLSEQFQDKSNAVITLYPEEIRDLLKGISLKDIYSARRANPRNVDPAAIKQAEQGVKSIDIDLETLRKEIEAGLDR